MSAEWLVVAAIVLLCSVGCSETEKEKLQQKKLKELVQADKQLQLPYGSIEQIEAAREVELAANQMQIESCRNKIGDRKHMLQDIHERIVSDGKRELIPQREAELAQIYRDLVVQRQNLAVLQQEKQRINDRYDIKGRDFEYKVMLDRLIARGV